MKKPVVSKNALVAKDAVVCGDVTIEAGANIWFHAVLRGDHAPITIGKDSNVQDQCVLHVDEGYPLVIGERVTVGHGAILHGCSVGDDTLIGMGSIILNGAKIGRGCIVGAGSLVTQNTVIPDGMMVLGSPAKVRRALTPEERSGNRASALDYVEEALDYEREGWFTRG